MAVLMAWIADLEEQLLILGVQHLSCPVCTAVYHNLAETNGCGVHMGEATISALKEVVMLHHGVGGILVPCANRLYGPVLTLWMYLAHYESGILQSGCFFDQISRSTPKPAVDVS